LRPVTAGALAQAFSTASATGLRRATAEAWSSRLTQAASACCRPPCSGADPR